LVKLRLARRERDALIYVAIVDRLHAETQKARGAGGAGEIGDIRVEPMPMTVDELSKFYRDDVAAIVKLARDVNLVPTN
jgi:hypothetical protein